jgi:molybdate transport system substrate-binding protein
MKNYRIIIAFILIILMNSFSAFAEEKISVAVAANFISAFKEIAAGFEAKTKIKVEGTFFLYGKSLQPDNKRRALRIVFIRR